MGNATWTNPQIPLKDGTTLVEIEISHMDHAALVSGMKPGGYTPLVLVPKGQCCGWMTRVPEGFFAIVTSFGAERGVYEPGHYCLPPWQQISYLVTKQLTVFDTPVKDCKTADNVTVNLDVIIVFEIVEARNFVYNLGPEKLDGLLRAAQEEALRGLASSVGHDKVFELQGMDTESITSDMNSKFEQFGINIHHVTVKNVRLPQDLMSTLEKRTIFNSKEIEIKMEQQLNMQKMNNENKLVKISEETEVEKQNADEEAVTAKARMEQEVAAVRSATSKEISKIEAEKEANVQQLLSDGELEVARLQNERDGLAREVQMELSKERNEILAEARAYRREVKARETLENAQNRTKAQEVLAQAEADSAEAMAARRQHLEDKAKLQVYRGLAANNSVRIASSAEVSARGLSLRDDNVSQLVQSAVRFARAKISEYGGDSAAPGAEPFLSRRS